MRVTVYRPGLECMAREGERERDFRNCAALVGLAYGV